MADHLSVEVLEEGDARRVTVVFTPEKTVEVVEENPYS
jgi:hypothetical protein